MAAYLALLEELDRRRRRNLLASYAPYRKLTLAYVSGAGSLPTTSDGVWLMFVRAGDKGADGLGSGDFSGPASSVTDNIVTFAGTTGKAGKDSGVAVASLVAGPASATADNIATFNGTTGKIVKDSGVAVSGLAPKASPTLTGTPTAPTAAAGTNSTQIATTAYVDTTFAPKASPTFTGTVTVPDGSFAPAKLDNGAATSILGRSANSGGARADIAAAADDTVMRRVGSALGFGQLTAGMVPAGLVTYAMVASAAVATNSEFQLGTASKLLSAAALKSTVAYQALTDAATISWDMSLGNNGSVALAGNRTLGNPTNANPLFGFVLKVTATTSSRTLSLGANYVVAAGVEAFPITIATTETIFLAGFVDTSSRIVVTGVVRT